MKKLLVIFFALFLFTSFQFSRPVVMIQGHVFTEDSLPISAILSIREINDTAQEITRSISNKNNGKYLVILKPDKQYWIHIEGDSMTFV